MIELFSEFCQTSCVLGYFVSVDIDKADVEFGYFTVPVKKTGSKWAIGSSLAKVVDRTPLVQELIDSCKDPLIGQLLLTFLSICFVAFN